MSSSNNKQKILFGPYEVTTQVFLQTQHSFALVNLKPLLPGHVLVCPLRQHRRLTDLNPEELTDLLVAVQRVQRMLARRYFPPSSSSSYSASPSLSSSSTPSVSNPQGAAPARTPPGPRTGGADGDGEGEGGGSFNIALQDGPEAGQTVPHVHVHIIPRVRNGGDKKDTAAQAGHPDELYERMHGEDGNVGGALWDAALGRRPAAGGAFPRIEDCDRAARSMAEMEEEAATFRQLLGEMERDGKSDVLANGEDGPG